MKTKLTVLLLVLVFKFTKALPDGSINTSKQKPFSGHEFTLKLGMTIPVGAYQREFIINQDDVLKNNISGENGGFGAKLGGSFDASSYFCFKNNKAISKFGLKATYLNYSFNKFEWKSVAATEYYQVRFLSIKVGPAIRLPLKDGNAIRFYYQLCPTYSWHGGFNNTTSAFRYLDYANLNLNHGFGWKNEIGFDANMKRLLVGLSFNFGNIHYKEVEFHRTASLYLPAYLLLISKYANQSIAVKAPSNYINLNFGFLFN